MDRWACHFPIGVNPVVPTRPICAREAVSESTPMDLWPAINPSSIPRACIRIKLNTGGAISARLAEKQLSVKLQCRLGQRRWE